MIGAKSPEGGDGGEVLTGSTPTSKRTATTEKISSNT